MTEIAWVQFQIIEGKKHTLPKYKICFHFHVPFSISSAEINFKVQKIVGNQAHLFIWHEIVQLSVIFHPRLKFSKIQKSHINELESCSTRCVCLVWIRTRNLFSRCAHWHPTTWLSFFLFPKERWTFQFIVKILFICTIHRCYYSTNHLNECMKRKFHFPTRISGIHMTFNIK